MNNFNLHTPTRILFGKGAIAGLREQIPHDARVLITYGGGSVKKTGVLDQVYSALEGLDVREFGGIEPNPSYETLMNAVKIAREEQITFLLAVGGGSVCDYAKAVSVSVNCDEDPWEKYYLRFEEPGCETLPVGCVLTMVGTGSEMNAGAVITDHASKMKICHVFRDEKIMPRFAILNPRYTMTLPHRQMVAGCYDIFSHICEQYFSGADDNTSDYISEGLMRSLLHYSRIANENPVNSLKSE